MLAALAGMLGGGGGASASSSASSGPTSQGNQGVQIGGIQTGGSSGSVPQWMLIAGVVLAAIYLLKRR